MKTSKKTTGYPSIDKTHLRDTTFWERHPFIPPLTISAAIDWVSRGHLDEPVIWQNDLKVTRGQFIEDARMVSEALLELGIKPGEIIAISCPNLYQSLVIFKAANQIGAVVTFLNEKATDQELIRYLNLYESPLLVTYNKTRAYANWIERRSSVENVINISARKRYLNSRKRLSHNLYTKYIMYHQLHSHALIYRHGSKKRVHKRFGGNKPALILYTSGSTGEPKSMVFTNRNVLAALTYLKYSTHTKPYDKTNFWWLGVVPFMYPYGLICSVFVSLLGGFGACLAPDMGPDTINDYYRKDAQVICGSPAFLEVSRRNLSETVRCPSLRTFISGGDFLSEKQSRSATEFFHQRGAKNVMLCNGSGNGELLGCCTNSMGTEYRPETVGKLILGPDYLIVEPEPLKDLRTTRDTYLIGDKTTIKEVKYGEPGELLVSGKHVFREYYGEISKTRDVKIRYKGKTWYRTGNIGFVDEDRYFVLIGRASRFYINSQFNKVYCERVQQAVCAFDFIESCAVVPIPDQEMLFRSKAYIVLNKDNEPNAQKKEFIINRLQHPSSNDSVILKDYEVPINISFVDSLPRTDADKVDYELLKQRAEQEALI